MILANTCEKIKKNQDYKPAYGSSFRIVREVAVN
jgi:hypothetical protein